MEYTIKIEGGETFAFSTAEDTLLRGALRAGISMPHECSVGGCGACRFDLVEGEMETLWDDAPGLSERDRKRGRRLACQCKPKGDCTIRVRCSSEYTPAVASRRGVAQVASKRMLTADMCEFTLRTEGPADFLAGQYALLYPPGITGARAYSLSNLSNDDRLWQFIIRRVPGGKGSNALFDQVDVGDNIVIDGPYGHAYFRPEVAREIVCIAGGSGLAPALSVARAALARPDGPSVHFFDGVRTAADLCAQAELDAIGAAPDRLHYTPVISMPEKSPGWSGATGFVHEVAERTLTQPLTAYEYYFAGPPPMIEAVQSLLLHKHQVPYQQIHFDRFV